ncbi:uncharacterized protein LOC136088449 isoform X2 [Hydra vulgaris]|uniref:Uncharacterized protein LOC136088449 isoform X2 n=1 Tax=Hydra vulgaris TaxID=6087 RepID=A0ABM4D1X4_HYDVU
MKKMIRFFQTKNIKLPSLFIQRKVLKYWSGNNLIVEDIELLFELKNKKGAFELKDTPTAYINDLPSHIIKVLDELERDKSLRVFIFGDDVFLCAIYGITGATGRHCCLFCEITSSEMQLKTNARTQPILMRTLETLKSD